MPRSREELETRRSELEAELSEVHSELESALEEATDTAVEAVEGTAEGAAETVTEAETAAEEAAADAAEAAEEVAEAAAEVAGEVEDAVTKAVEETPGIDMGNFDEVYARTLSRLREEGIVPNPETALDAPEEIVAPVTDEIAPRDEHRWTRPRRFLGRTW